MATFTLTELKRIVTACLDDEQADALDGALDTTFADLGYDSLTVYEIATRVQDGFGVAVSDDDLDGLKTPRDLLDHVSSRLTGV
ncbi:acyl carrier protein [Streptomyces sp. NPDC057702]|uniref:acyl carrier protein n=1 Tax=unclassified Streptomyces TaxID=2593676 RepID=UPI0036911B2A